MLTGSRAGASGYEEPVGPAFVKRKWKDRIEKFQEEQEKKKAKQV